MIRMHAPRIVVRIWVGVLVLLCAPFASAAQVAALPTYRIGVLAFRAVPQTQAQWQATADYLNEKIPEAHFQIQALAYADLDRAVAERRVEFVLTNPEHAIYLHTREGLRSIATLMPAIAGTPVTQFGGVIFTRSDRHDIQDLAGLKGRRIAAVGEQSLGGYLMQLWVLHRAGVVERGERLNMRYTGVPHDRVVTEVLQGRADAGFVRTGVLESMQAEGALRQGEIKLVHARVEPGFPLLLSTDLYPEWPFCVTRAVPAAQVKAVALALLRMPPDAPAARRGAYYGFAPPGDYQSVEAIMTRLRVHPARLDRFDLRDVLDKYGTWLMAALALLLAVSLLVSLRQRRDNRALWAAQQEGVALRAERDCLVSEMHDGIGAELALALKLVQGPAPDVALLRGHLSHCALEMRLMVDSLAPMDGDLMSVLGNLRYRVQPILEQAGIRLVWDASDVDAEVRLEADAVVQVLRIFQEAISNALRYAQASWMLFEVARVATETGPGIAISLADNGVGCGEVEVEGRGLSSMRQRAQRLGGQLSVSHTSTGTTVALTLPIGGGCRSPAAAAQRPRHDQHRPEQ